MPGKNIESKFTVKSQFDESGIKRMREEVKGLVEDIARLREAEIPSGYRPPPKPKDSRPDPKHEEEKRKHAAEREREKFLHRVGHAPGGAAGMLMHGAHGGGMEVVSSIMERAGGSLMGAFGGFGALVGLPLLGAAATFGVARALSQPSMQWHQATYGVRSRLGHEWVKRVTAEGVDAGISPMEMAQYLPQLERVGAQQAVGALGGLRELGITPELALPFLTGITRAGGAGGRTPQEYETMKRMTASLVKDTHSQTEILDQVLTATESIAATTGDVGGLAGTKQIMNLARWLQESPSAALRGQAGGRLIGGMMSAIATPGGAGKEMLLWSVLSQDPNVRSQFIANNPHLARLMPKEGPLSLFQMGMLREDVSSLPVMLNWAMQQGEMTPMILTRLLGAKNWKTAGSIMARYAETGRIPDNLIKEAEKEFTSRTKDPNESLADIAKYSAHLEHLKIMAVDLDKIRAIMDTEKALTERFAQLLKSDAFDAAIKSLPGMANALVALSRLEIGTFLTEMAKAVRDGVRMAFGLRVKAPDNPSAEWEANDEAAARLAPYTNWSFSMRGYNPAEPLDQYLTRVHGWQFEAPQRIKEMYPQ